MSLSPPRALRALPLTLLCAACASPRSPEPTAAPAPKPLATPVAAPVAAPVEARRGETGEPLALTVQSGWIEEEPASDKRKAQFRLPHAEHDTEDASLIVYYFGGTGGTREANLERWASQFEQPDGSSSSDLIQSSARKVGELEVFDASLSGTYVAETAPGSGVRVNKPGWRMLASIVDTSEGPWYFKLIGPEATVAKWEASYTAYMNSVRPGN